MVNLTVKFHVFSFLFKVISETSEAKPQLTNVVNVVGLDEAWR